MAERQWKADPRREFPVTPAEDWAKAAQLFEELRRHPEIDDLSIGTPHSFSMHDIPPENWHVYYSAIFQEADGGWVQDDHYCSEPTLLEAMQGVHALFFPKEKLDA